MKIKLWWPNCNYRNHNWGSDGIDSYWVECTYAEAEAQVFDYLTVDQVEKSKMYWDPRKRDSTEMNLKTDTLCYLISKDLSSIEPFAWYYPYSGQWNAYCPFVEIDELQVNDLNEIRNITIE